MKTNLILFAAFLMLISCGPDTADGNYEQMSDKDFVDEQVDAATKASIDSVARTTAEGKILYPLPDTLLTLIEQKQPRARVVTLPDETMKNERLQVENPLFLRGNFNGNNSLDYAVQVLQNDSIHILAYMDYPSGQAQEVKVASYPAQKIDNLWYSTYQLKLAPEDSLVQDVRDQKRIPLPTDGISVVSENRTTLYLLQNGRFIPFDAKK